MKKHSTLVYSTDRGRIQPEPRTAEADTTADGIVRLRRETRGRGGKTVTVVDGVSTDSEVLRERCTQLKRLCGSGGTVQGSVIEIQGDHRERILAALSESGYRVKLAGG